MMPYPRKLLPPGDDDSTHFPLSPTTNSSFPPTSSKIEDRETPTTGVSCCAYNNLKLNPPFDSAMALTVLVLLTALFFMGFFSIYIRRFADESSVDPTRRRRGRTSGSDSTESSTTTSYAARSRVSAKGVDPATIESLPVHAYEGGAVKQGMKMELECAICLSEFEEREWVKEIPYCSHVFHVECIDTWLSTHVTCPLCRTAKLLPSATPEEVVEIEEVAGDVAGEEEDEEGGSGVDEVQGNVENDREVRLMVSETDTWSGEEKEVGRLDVMKTASCSVGLHRSLSF